MSGLDYTVDALPRQVLEKALVASERSTGRLYATQFMLVLLRAKIPNFEVWGLPLLIKQTRDKERKVVLAALEILDEACHDRVSYRQIDLPFSNILMSFKMNRFSSLLRYRS